MKSMTRECLYRQGIMALLDEIQLEHSGKGIRVAGQGLLPFFIFPENNVFGIYQETLRRRIRSPALIFCTRHMVAFLQDVYFSERLYFVPLDAPCDKVKKAILAAIKRYTDSGQRKPIPVCPWRRLNRDEVDVVSYLIQGYKPATISTATNMPFRHISQYKRSAMRKLKVTTFPELYFKVKLLESLV